LIITVDGLSASGKGSLAKALGEYLNYPVLDTGSIWRCLAVRLNERVEGPVEVLLTEDEIRAEVFDLLADEDFPLNTQDHKDLRTERTSRTASIISCDGKSREWVDEMIALWASRDGGCVLDGRDVGRNVVPEADLKLFLIAEPEDRASWREIQLYGKSMSTRNGPPQHTKHYPNILADIRGRDAREINRESGASIPADDAHIINASRFISAERVFDYVKKGLLSRDDWTRIKKTSGVSR